LNDRTLGYYGAYAVTIYLTVLGRFSIGALTFLAGSFRASRDLIQRILLSLSQVVRAESVHLRPVHLLRRPAACDIQAG